VTLRLMSRLSWSPRTFFVLAAHCGAGVHRFGNDNWHPVTAA